MHSDVKDPLGQLAQAGTPCGVCLVRIEALDAANRYSARPMEFDDADDIRPAGPANMTVTNLAEPTGQAGTLRPGTLAAAIDVEGRWIVCVRSHSAIGGATFPAKIVAANGGPSYTIREQQFVPGGTLADATGAADLPACNLAELSASPGGGLAVGTVVVAMSYADTDTPPSLKYIFDHPA